MANDGALFASPLASRMDCGIEQLLGYHADKLCSLGIETSACIESNVVVPEQDRMVRELAHYISFQSNNHYVPVWND